MPYAVVINGSHKDEDTFTTKSKALARFEQIKEAPETLWATIVNQNRKNMDVIAYWKRP